jgi:hypothetical protein
VLIILMRLDTVVSESSTKTRVKKGGCGVIELGMIVARTKKELTLSILKRVEFFEKGRGFV